MTLYPRIYFACHTRHVADPRRNRVLSSHQASVLDHLDEVEPTGLLTHAAHMGFTASTMSLTVDRLARGGYVARSRDPKDRRRVNLLLTRAGVVSSPRSPCSTRNAFSSFWISLARKSEKTPCEGLPCLLTHRRRPCRDAKR
jgi:hypothetical protein